MEEECGDEETEKLVHHSGNSYMYGRGTEVRVCARDGKHIEKTPSGVKAKVKKNRVRVSWKKLKGKNRKYLKKISSIQVQYAFDKSFRDAVTKTVPKKKTKTTVTLPRKKTVYYVRVRYTGSGGVSKWSKVKKVRVK